MKTHNTFVIGFNNGEITYIKSYDYFNEKEECQKDLLRIQENTSSYTGWRICKIGSWKLLNKHDETDQLEINIPV